MKIQRDLIISILVTISSIAASAWVLHTAIANNEPIVYEIHSILVFAVTAAFILAFLAALVYFLSIHDRG